MIHRSPRVVATGINADGYREIWVCAVHQRDGDELNWILPATSSPQTVGWAWSLRATRRAGRAVSATLPRAGWQRYYALTFRRQPARSPKVRVRGFNAAAARSATSPNVPRASFSLMMVTTTAKRCRHADLPLGKLRGHHLFTFHQGCGARSGRTTPA